MVVVAERGEHQHPGGRALGQDPAGRADPVHAGHAQVHHHHVGREPGGQRDRLPAVARLADHLEVGLGVAEHPQAGPDQLLVVDEQDADHAAAPGSTVRTSQPAPAGPAVSTPPSTSTRSRMPVSP